MKNTFIPLAYNFWNVVQLLVQQMEKHGNTTEIYLDYIEEESEVDGDAKVNEIFKQNDNNIGVAVMFNFYHGLELFMKGLLQVENIILDKSDHNLQNLYKQIKASESKYTSSLIQLLKDHIYNAKSFNPFFESNNINVNDFYIGLRYPQNKDGDKHFKYFTIRGKEEETFKIYKAMSDATHNFREEVVKWLRSKRK